MVLGLCPIAYNHLHRLLITGSIVFLCLSGTRGIELSAVPVACSATQYFDSTLYSCQSCPSNLIVDTSTVDGFGNYVSCKCPLGYRLTANNCMTDSSGDCESLVCTLCTSGYSFSDNSGCATCGSSAVNASSDCSCSALTDVLVETDSLGLSNVSPKECSACPTGMAVVTVDTSIAGQEYSASDYQCRSCPDTHMSMSVTPAASPTASPSYSCSCAASYIQMGVTKIGAQYCLYSSSVNSDTYQYFNNLNAWSTLPVPAAGSTVASSVISATIKHYLVRAAIQCKYYGGPDNLADCQTLANLCVLVLFDVNYAPCALFQSIKSLSSRSTTTQYASVSSWGYRLPWIYYPAGSANTYCLSKEIALTVNLNSQYLKYMVFSYSLNGTFLGSQELSTLFAYCGRKPPFTSQGGGSSASTKWQIFGYNSERSYECDLTLLISGIGGETTLEAQRFYELYFVDSDDTLSPVPVRVVNKPDFGSGAGSTTGRTVNAAVRPQFLCNAGDELTRRFFLYDVVSAIPDDGNDDNVTPEFIRYASYVSVAVGIRKDDPTKIYSPVLTIQYATMSTADMVTYDPSSSSASSASTTTTYTVAGIYTMDMGTFLSDYKKVEATAMAFGSALTLLKLYNWSVRNGRQILLFSLTPGGGSAGVNFVTLFYLITYAMHSCVQIFFPLTTLLCWYWFVFFKMQAVVDIMITPMDTVSDSASLYYPFYFMIHLMTFFQLGHVLLLIYRQVNADIFFLDWEPAASPAQPAKPAGGESRARSGSQDRPEPPLPNAPVSTGGTKISVWRTILVANEWCEMQTIRKTNVLLTLFFLGFFLIGLNLQYNATSQPDLNDTTQSKQNIILRFANTTFFWLALSLGQWLWKWLLYERYLSEPIEQLFVDFCTIAKISIFAMDEQFHGFYLHCRSPHQYADGSMMELLDMLHKEEAGLVVDRSLENAPKDVQSFEIYASGEFRLAFDKVYNPLLMQTSATGTLGKGVDPFSLFTGGSGFQGYNRLPTSLGTWSMNSGGMVGAGAGGAWGGLAAQRAAGVGGVNGRVSFDKLFRLWADIAIFLKDWIDNNFNKAGLRYVVREKTYLQQLLSLPPDLNLPEQPSIFYPDRKWDYASLMFLGQEPDLLMLNILAYSLFDLWFDNTMISILLTYLLESLLCHMRYTWGKEAISRKTLVDSRFLI